MRESKKAMQERKEREWQAKRARTKRRMANNPHRRKKVWKAMLEVIGEMAADRPSYFESFITDWRCSAEAANWLGETIVKLGTVTFDDNLKEHLFKPYEMLSLMIFARLMDQLDYEEENRLKAVVAEVDSAWQKLGQMISSRYPGQTALCEAIARDRGEVQRIVLDLYSGELAPAFRRDWVLALKAFEADIAALEKFNNDCVEKIKKGEVPA